MVLGVVALVFRCRLVGGDSRVNDEASDRHHDGTYLLALED